MNEQTANCVIGRRPHEARRGYLCEGHFTHLSTMLRLIEDEAAILDTRPSMAVQPGGGSGVLASERSPAVLDAIVARDPRRGLVHWASDDFDPWGLDDTRSVLETLHSIARTVREDRQLAPPAKVTISGERDFLTRQLDWLAGREDIDERYGEIRELLGQLQSTNKSRPESAAGRCFLSGDREDGTCGGRIWRRESKHYVWRVAADRCVWDIVDVNDGPAYCERCGQEWDGADLDRLNLILEQQQREASRPRTEDGRPMLTQQELMAELGMTWVNVRVIIHRKRLVSVDGHYDPDHFRRKASA